jgi:hypothetical protein
MADRIPNLSKILQITAKDLRTGEGRSQYDDTGGVWQQSIGLNAFLSDDNARFLCATTATPTQIDSIATYIQDTPIAYALDTRPNNAYMYVLGNSGRFYSILYGGTIATIRPQSTLTAVNYPTGGMAFGTDVNGTSYLFLCRGARLVRWDLNTADSATHWNESTVLNTADVHPMHKFSSTIYFGNGYSLGAIPLTSSLNDVGSIAAVNTSVVKIDNANLTITAIGDDGRYVVFAASLVQQNSFSAASDVRIFWYSGVGINWDWEVTIKGERSIRAIVQNSLGTFAIGEQNIWQLAFGQQAKLVRTFDTADAIHFDPSTESTFVANGAAQFGDALIFGQRGAVYGKRNPREPVTFSHPLQGHTGNIYMIAPDFLKSKIYVGTDNNKLWLYDMSTAGTTSNSWKTRWFDLKQQMSISRLEIEMPQGIGASDVLGVVVETPDGKTATASLSQTTMSASRRYYPKIPLKGNLIGAQVRFTFTPSAGSPKFGGVSLYGRPNTE